MRPSVILSCHFRQLVHSTQWRNPYCWNSFFFDQSHRASKNLLCLLAFESLLGFLKTNTFLSELFLFTQYFYSSDILRRPQNLNKKIQFFDVYLLTVVPKNWEICSKFCGFRITELLFQAIFENPSTWTLYKIVDS